MAISGEKEGTDGSVQHDDAAAGAGHGKTIAGLLVIYEDTDEEQKVQLRQPPGSTLRQTRSQEIIIHLSDYFNRKFGSAA